MQQTNSAQRQMPDPVNMPEALGLVDVMFLHEWRFAFSLRSPLVANRNVGLIRVCHGPTYAI